MKVHRAAHLKRSTQVAFEITQKRLFIDAFCSSGGDESCQNGGNQTFAAAAKLIVAGDSFDIQFKELRSSFGTTDNETVAQRDGRDGLGPLIVKLSEI